MSNIVIENLNTQPLHEQKLEIVERKGLGHPDYICDSLMDKVSVNLCSEYLKKLGYILHHNTDKGMLVSGKVKGELGGGNIVDPMLLVFGDRATFEADGVEFDIENIVTSTAKEWFSENLRFVDPSQIKYQIELKSGSSELTDIFRRKKENEVLGANDTSAAVGFAPSTFTEWIVHETEKHLNSSTFKKEYPESGEDVKVMGVRNNNNIHLTVAMPLIDSYIKSEDEYFKRKNEIMNEIDEFVSKYAETENNLPSTSISFNTLDEPGKGLNGIYTTVTGTSAEDADCGQVGRGNRVNGIIPLNRPSSAEAAAGKNPVSHVGKIYNALSHRIAYKIYNEIPDVSEAYVWLLSDIGKPIDAPRMATTQISMEAGTLDSVKAEVHEVINSELENIQQFCMELAKGKIPLY